MLSMFSEQSMVLCSFTREQLKIWCFQCLSVDQKNNSDFLFCCKIKKEIYFSGISWFNLIFIWQVHKTGDHLDYHTRKTAESD